MNVEAMAEIIQTLIKRRGWANPSAFAASPKAIAAGLNQPTLNRLLNGKHGDARLSTIQAVAKALDVTVSHILGEIPLPDENSEANARGLVKLQQDYIKADDRGRDHILRVAEQEAAYTHAPDKAA